MYHDNNWWYKQSIDVEFFFELLSKTLKLLDLTQLVTCNTIQEENDSHTGKQGTGTRQNVVFLVDIHVTKMGKMWELGTKPSKTKLNKTKHINKLGVTWTF